MIDKSTTWTIGGSTSGGLEVKNGILNCVGATLPDCQNILDIVPSGPHAGEASNAGHYTISGGTLMIGTKNAGATLNRGIGQFKITGGMVDADATAPGTIYSNHDFDIQGGIVNAVLAGTGHEQGTTTLLTQGLNKTSDSLATLGAANLYTGPTAIIAGTMALSEKGQISTSSLISTATGATFEILAGTHTVGTISGTGITKVLDGATLTATSIVQDTLVIGGTGGAALAAVPEPSTLVLAAMGLIAMCFVVLRRFR
jgi:autotransporter-associated beta strand protein